MVAITSAATTNTAAAPVSHSRRGSCGRRRDGWPWAGSAASRSARAASKGAGAGGSRTSRASASTPAKAAAAERQVAHCCMCRSARKR
jgi:hypothetical protein